MNIFTINQLIPSFNELISLIFLLYLFGTFLVIGRIISKNSSTPINISIGWSIFTSFNYFFLIIFGLNLFILNSIYFFISFFAIFLYFKKFNQIKFNKNYYKFFFIIPLFFILMNTKTFGYDSFAYILKRTVYLLEYNELPTELFRSNYPITSQLLHYFTNFLINKFTENIPALIDFIFLFLMSLVIFEIFKSYKFPNKAYLALSFIIIFFNPMIMNVYSYTSYEDLHSSFLVMIIFLLCFKNNYELFNVDKRNFISLALLLSLLSSIKITGVILSFSIILSLFVILIKKKKLNLKTFKYFIFLCFFSLLLPLIWNFHLFNNNIITGIEFKGFRINVLETIPTNYYNQFLEKKLLFLLNLFFFISPLFLIAFKRFKDLQNLIIFIFFQTFIWNLFLIFFMIFLQNENHALTFHNYFRYISQLSGIFTAGFLIISLEIFSKKFNFKIIDKSYYLFSFIFIVLTVSNFDKIRRDFNYNDQILRKKIQENLENKDYLQELIKDEGSISYNRKLLEFYINILINRNF